MDGYRSKLWNWTDDKVPNLYTREHMGIFGYLAM